MVHTAVCFGILPDLLLFTDIPVPTENTLDNDDTNTRLEASIVADPLDTVTTVADPLAQVTAEPEFRKEAHPPLADPAPSTVEVNEVEGPTVAGLYQSAIRAERVELEGVRRLLGTPRWFQCTFPVIMTAGFIISYFVERLLLWMIDK